MTPKQVSAIIRLTNNVLSANSYLDGGEYNGTLTFSTEVMDNGEVMIKGNNLNGLRWFETTIMFLAFVGKRGGVKVGHAEGVSRKVFS